MKDSIAQTVKKLSGVKSQKAIDNYVKKIWLDDNEQFFFALEISLDWNLDLESVPQFEEPFEVSNSMGDKMKFVDFVRFACDVKHQKIHISEVKQALRNLALTCDEAEWNTIYRKILLGTFHHDLPMNKIAMALKKLTKA